MRLFKEKEMDDLFAVYPWTFYLMLKSEEYYSIIIAFNKRGKNVWMTSNDWEGIQEVNPNNFREKSVEYHGFDAEKEGPPFLKEHNPYALETVKTFKEEGFEICYMSDSENYHNDFDRCLNFAKWSISMSRNGNGKIPWYNRG
ncbi:MAG: hypothetical protein ACOC5T_01005 [Elusimicrobiota bacterium]